MLGLRCESSNRPSHPSMKGQVLWVWHLDTSCTVSVAVGSTCAHVMASFYT
jgi:hypothetical protein